jgi:hypothetical protein
MKLPGRHYRPSIESSGFAPEAQPLGCLAFFLAPFSRVMREKVREAIEGNSQVQLPDFAEEARMIRSKIDGVSHHLDPSWYFNLAHDAKAISLHPILMRELIKIIYAYVQNQQEVCGVKAYKHTSGYHLFRESNGQTWFPITSPRAWAAMHLLMQQASHADDGCYFLPDNFKNPFVESLRSDTDYMLPHHLMRKLKLKPKRV